jgi:hypothetical protein
MASNLTAATAPDAAADAASPAERNRSSDHSMHILPPLPSPALIWRRRAFALAALTLLAGCGTNNGDFGEVRGTYLRDDMHDWLGKDIFAGPKTIPSSFKLTDDERALRDLAYPLIEAPYDRQQWYSAFGEYNEVIHDPRTTFNRSEYANRLLKSYYRSSSAQYAKLAEDIRNDITRLPQFFETAARVLDTDEKRRVSLGYISELSPKERDNALRRIRENAALVLLVQTKLSQRVSAYRYALERLVITTPSALSVDVERSTNQLQAQIAYYRTHSAPTWVREQSLASNP